MRTKSSFDLVVRAPYHETAALFGPEGERAWAGEHWDPQFIYPQPAHDEEDAVFSIRHGKTQAIWVTALHDLPGRHFKYVYILGDVVATTIDVRFTELDPASTAVHVAYTRTALNTEGRSHVVQLSAADQSAGPEWQRSIDAYLAARIASALQHPNP